MRKLQTEDVFSAMRIIKTAGIREEIKAVAREVGNGVVPDVKEVGMDIILATLEACANKGVDDAFYEFFGGIFEMDPKELKTQELGKTFAMLKEYGEKYLDKETAQAFFHSLSSLMK